MAVLEGAVTGVHQVVPGEPSGAVLRQPSLRKACPSWPSVRHLVIQERWLMPATRNQKGLGPEPEALGEAGASVEYVMADADRPEGGLPGGCPRKLRGEVGQDEQPGTRAGRLHRSADGQDVGDVPKRPG